MNYIRLIPYIVILIFMGYIGYKEFDNHKKQSELKDEIISMKDQLNNYKEKQSKLTIELVTKINEINNKNYEELNEKISKINAVVNTNNNLVTKLRNETTRISNDWNTFSDATKDTYVRQINDEFTRSTELLTRIAGQDDRNYEAAVTYYDMLVEYHKLSLKYQEDIDKLKK